MFVHSVFFWLKKELTADEIARFQQGLDTLKSISCAESVYVGTPADTHRPVVERGYDFALTVLLKDLASHDAYQEADEHQAFLKEFAGYWSRIQIFDAD